MYCRYISNPIVINNTFSQNKACIGAGIATENSSPIIINSILWADSIINGGQDEIYVSGGSPSLFYSNIQGGWAGEGNINIDPLFRDPANDDFHLMSTSCGDAYNSPCIDAGDPTILDLLMDCQWGLGTDRSDMGAYGGRDSATTDIDNPIAQIPQRLELLQNYPNPFNPSTTIKYSIPQPLNVQIDIFNLLGQRVATLFDGYQNAGEYSVTWNASGVPSGVYFAKLNAGNKSNSIKLMLLK